MKKITAIFLIAASLMGCAKYKQHRDYSYYTVTVTQYTPGRMFSVAYDSLIAGSPIDTLVPSKFNASCSFRQSPSPTDTFKIIYQGSGASSLEMNWGKVNAIYQEDGTFDSVMVWVSNDVLHVSDGVTVKEYLKK